MSEKDKLNTIEVLIIRLYISHDKFISINNVLRQYKKQKNPEIPVEYIKKTLTYCDSCKKKKNEKEKSSDRNTKRKTFVKFSRETGYS